MVKSAGHGLVQVERKITDLFLFFLQFDVLGPGDVDADIKAHICKYPYFCSFQAYIMEYNTTRKHLEMREYGRHVQQMVDHLLTIEDKERRQRNANAVIEMMGFLTPHLKTQEDYRQKLWDHLFLISDFKLDVESPYPKPTRESLMAKPKPLPYPKRYPKYSHLGKHLEMVIAKAMAEENPEKKSGFAHIIAYYMKLAYNTWHKELIPDDSIRAELNTITKGELEFTHTPFVRAYREHDDRFKRGGKGGFQQRNRNGGPGGGPGGKNRPQQKFWKKRFK